MNITRHVEVCVPTDRLDHIRPQVEAVIATYQGITEVKATRLTMENGQPKARPVRLLRISYTAEQERTVLTVMQRIFVRTLLNLGEDEVRVTKDGETKVYTRPAPSAKVLPFNPPRVVKAKDVAAPLKAAA